MLAVKIAQNSNGSHANQTGTFVPTGYICVPSQLEAKTRLLLPYINLHIEDGVLVDVSAGERIVSDEEAATELTAAKSERIAQSKADLAGYLATHPLTWTNGEQYSITQEKQNQLTSTLAAAQIDGEPPEWNTTGGQCRVWDVTELSALAVAIKNRVKALVKYQQAQEIAMNAATTLDELNAITVDYDSVQ